jgi:hypothetical protein
MEVLRQHKRGLGKRERYFAASAAQRTTRKETTVIFPDIFAALSYYL